MSKKASLGKIPKEAPSGVPALDNKDWEAEDALRDLLRAEEHKQNDELMKRVHEKLDKKKKGIKSIADLRKRKAELDLEDDDDV